MAEKWTIAFGRYLRLLRERRGLSLENVASLSQAFPETLDKGYISKCENGHHRMNLSKVIPFCRIYHVSADVLVERMELDMELDRVGSPPTANLTFAELTEAGREAKQHGRNWDGYAFLRDALPRAQGDPVEPRFRDSQEQVAVATINCASAARSLRRFRYAVYELAHVHERGVVSMRYMPLLLERLAVVNRNLGNSEDAHLFGEQSIDAAESPEGQRFLGLTYSSRALQTYHDGDLQACVELYKRAFVTLRGTGDEHACANALSNLGQVYYKLGRYTSSRRAVCASQNLAHRLGQESISARNHLLLGELDALQGRFDTAHSHFEACVLIARQLNDQLLRFLGEYRLFKQANRLGNVAASRSICRRLKKLANYIPTDTNELQEFQRMLEKPELGAL